jgi:hypothetical protein
MFSIVVKCEPLFDDSDYFPFSGDIIPHAPQLYIYIFLVYCLPRLVVRFHNNEFALG